MHLLTGATLVSDLTRAVAERARRIYDERLREVLEGGHTGRFVRLTIDYVAGTVELT